VQSGCEDVGVLKTFVDFALCVLIKVDARGALIPSIYSLLTLRVGPPRDASIGPNLSIVAIALPPTTHFSRTFNLCR
jgi:hypothetical protein